MLDTIETRAARTNRILHLLGEVERASAQRREADLACARALVELVAMDGLHVAHCASAGELGERHGLSAFETRDLLDLGRGLPLVPGLEEHVRAGRIPAASGACLGRVYSTPGLLREGDDWITWAQHESTQMLRRRLQRRLDEFRVGDAPVVPLTVFVEREDLDDFHRARTAASRKAGTALSGGATLKTLTQHYLASFDVMRRQTGKRRVPDTTYVAGRYIPVAVRREVYDRQQGRCAIPFCDHVLFLDFAHLVWHASGGSREADNLLLLCSEHHTWFDVGAIRLTGTAAAPRRRGSRMAAGTTSANASHAARSTPSCAIRPTRGPACPRVSPGTTPTSPRARSRRGRRRPDAAIRRGPVPMFRAVRARRRTRKNFGRS